MSEKIKISVVTPSYRSSRHIVELYSRVSHSLQQITDRYEIIFVNDASPENDWEVIRELAARNPNVVGINLSRNFGQHYAISAGLDAAKGEWVVVMDCDLQDKPEEIPNLYRKAAEGFEIVLARRAARKDGFFKRLSSGLFYMFLGYLTDTKQDPSVANFGIYHRKVINVITSMRESLRCFPVMVKWVGFRTAYLDVEHLARKEDKSSYTLKKLFKLAFDVMIAFSDKPLRLAVKIGFFSAFISGIVAVCFFIRAIRGDFAIIGWPSLIVSIWFVGGVIIFLLGILGVYVGKTFDETKKRPLYIVNSTVESGSDGND